MNSNYASAQLLRSRAGWQPSAPASEGFAKTLSSVPAEDVLLPHAAEAEDSPAQAKAAEAAGETADPAAPPLHSRTGQTAAPATAPRSTTPHFASVPESVQYPLGPYRQAPPENGGEWWLTSPFTGEQPWLTQGFLDPYAAQPPEAEPGAEEADFLAVFGPRPNRETHPNRLLRGAAIADWERNREYFKGVGLPDGFTQEQLDAAGKVFEAWGLGRPLLYEGRYGWTAKFPSAGVADFEASPFAALEAPHLVIARYQIEMVAQGSEPSEKHPFVPPQVFGEEPLSA